MFEFFASLFDSSGFPPRWYCGNWSTGLGWLHIIADLGVWSAYVAIPLVLGYFVLRKKDIPFRSVFILFGMFILACGTTHLMEAIIFWWPAYRLAGAIKVATAFISWATVLALIPIAPRVLAMRSPDELEREILGRKEAEKELERQMKALRESEERFRLLVESTNDFAIFMLDPGGRVVSWNGGAERIKQYQSQEIVGEHLSRFYLDEDIQTGKPAQHLQIAEKEGYFQEEGWRQRKDGTRFWASVVISTLRDESGSLRGFSLITQDMTHRREAEENARRLLEEATARQAAEAHAAAVHREREQLRVTLDSIGDGVIATDAEGRVTLLNPVAETLTQWEARAVLGQPFNAVFPLLDSHTREAVENPVDRALREGAVIGPNNTILITRDQDECSIEDTAAPIRNEHGEIMGAVLVFRDMNEKRAAEVALRVSEERLSLAIEAASLGLWDWDIRTNDVLWNAHHERIFGYQTGRPQRTYQDFLDRIFPDDVERIEKGFQKAMQERREYRFEHRIRWPDGTTHWVEAFGKFYYDDAGRPLRSVGVLLDVTERKRYELSLQEADRKKNEFLATLAHELRNPLAPIRNALQIIRLTSERAAIEQARAMMERQLGQLVRLVDDLLDVSRISRNKLQLRKGRILLTSVIENAVETARPLVDAKGHTLNVKLPPEPIYLDADLTRLSQVFWNLLNNGAKYTDPGGKIDLIAELEENELVVRVRDTGIGIAADVQPGLFTLFSQVDNSLERTQGGLGIGLSLAKGLVELHGGRVEAHSEGLGHGSEFIVRLPVSREQKAAEKVAAPEAPPPAGPRRVLVVDDNRDAAASLSTMLALRGHDTRTSHDGLEALDLAAAFRPDVILLDIGMPRLNGYDVCKRIREQAWGKHITLIAQTGWGQDEDRRRSKEAGFDFHLVKPLDPAALDRLLAGLEVRKS